MARKRSALAAAGFVQCRMRIPASFHARLQNLKRQHRMRGLDSTVSAMIRKAMAHYAPDQLLVPPPPPDFDRLHQIALHIPREHHAYLSAVAHRNRGVNLGVALEAVGAYVPDLAAPPRSPKQSA